MKYVDIRYGIILGKGDASDWMDYEIGLTDEEAVAYDNAIADEIPLSDVSDLQDALERAYEEIEDIEIQISIDTEDEYVMECQGLAPMDEDELNDLVADCDPYALAFFGLENASEEELEEWDASDLDELPSIADFKKDFEPYSPFEEGWRLQVEFVDPNYD